MGRIRRTMIILTLLSRRCKSWLLSEQHLMSLTRFRAPRGLWHSRCLKALASSRLEEGSLDARLKEVDPLRPRPTLRRCIQDAPDEPGVYIMESGDGRKLYIGKSVKLSSRVPSYFNHGGDVTLAVSPAVSVSKRIAVMTKLVESIEYIVTPSGAEALMLEASLIRQHQPPFNVLLKDDKRNYPYACFTLSERYPRLIVTRDRPRIGGGREDRYYGPYIDAGQLKSMVQLVRRVLPLRERRRPLYKDKPCLNYDMGLCPGACQKLISEEDYAETVRLAEKVFRGQGEELVEKLRGRMERAAQAEEFELAGEFKEKIALVRGGLLGSALHFSSGGPSSAAAAAAAVASASSIESVLERSQDSTEGGFMGRGMNGELRRMAATVSRRDVVAVGLAGEFACFQVFKVRDGRLTGRLGFTYRVEEGLTGGEVLQACLERYWGDVLGFEGGADPRSLVFSSRPRPHVMNDDSASSSSPSFAASPSGPAEASAGQHFVDFPDEIVTADALPDGGSDLLIELLSDAKRAAFASVSSPGSDASIGGSRDASPRYFSDASDLDGVADTEGGVSRTSSGELGTLTRTGGEEAARWSAGKQNVETLSIVHGGAVGGERYHLCVMVSKNAELEAKRLRKSSEDTVEGLGRLGKMLGLSRPPERIEGLDVSHTGGGQAVASLVCFIGGKAESGKHRRYRIESPVVKKGHSDDYASVREVVARRFFPPASATSDGIDEGLPDQGPLPDVMLIDGGKGQLAAALEGAGLAAHEWRRRLKDLGDNPDVRVDAEVEGVGADKVMKRLAIDGISSAGPSSRVARPEDAWGDPVVGKARTRLSEPAVSSSPSTTVLDPMLGFDPDAVLLDTSDSLKPAHEGRANCERGFKEGSPLVDVGAGRRVAFVSLAKKDEEVFLPWATSPVATVAEAGPNSSAVLVLRKVRDEAHRFALSYHRKLRGDNMFRTASSRRGSKAKKSSQPTPDAEEAGGDFDGAEDEADVQDRSGFDRIAGLSGKTRRALVEAFGTLENARVAGEAEVRRISGVGPVLSSRIMEWSVED